MAQQLVMYEEEFHRINAVCDRLTKDANAKVVFIVDKNGQLIAATLRFDAEGRPREDEKAAELIGKLIARPVPGAFVPVYGN